MMNTPIIRLELENMKQSIVHALVQYNDELEKAIEAEIDKQIKAFDITAYIEKEVKQNLERVIETSLRQEMGWKLQSEITEAVKAQLKAKWEA